MKEKNTVKKDLTDFPFEDVKTSRWIMSMIVLIAGFLFISMGMMLMPRALQNTYFIGFVFLLICFSALFIIDRRFFTKLFRPLKKRDVLIIGLTIVLCYILAVAVSIGQKNLVKNPITEVINDRTILKIIVLTAFQLIGEEVLFVVPFLFVYNRMKKISGRNTALIMAWVISSLFFGMLHLQTYSFNFYQAFIVIGAIRMGMSLSYVLTKNLTVSYIAHFLYDTLILVGVFMAGKYGVV